MSSLGIIIYLAGISSGVAHLFVFLSAGLLIGGGTGLLTYASEGKKIPSLVWTLLLFCVVCGALSALIPSSQTIYMIAAAEYGQEAIASEFGQEVIKEAKDALLRTLRHASESVE